MFKRAITHRDEFIIAQALIYALDGLQRLAKDERPESNIDDMKAILAELRSRFVRWQSETPEDGCCLEHSIEVAKLFIRKNWAGEPMTRPVASAIPVSSTILTRLGRV